ncbi:hypothetical protein Q7526_10925 [Glaesserella parasuis]|uniref:hypothetical protein n=1 Tax=Glaesserella parasuis TaxID=738 RepID=UPI001365E899|nr:hypothetical protein [Glaesserella parasuis]MDG6231454.1 hypothetical protein [Glaesserella parasuis]MDO9768413.1 hypothetical protein [Glaesserella parasuis]MDO9797687.1 hypothetical protein [Glaesserella parasuis]MDP0342607.1 hypothetical protein [Glaesserella parasuis]MDP0358385.1 hypothetical protein [Glaesserella parasuis]
MISVAAGSSINMVIEGISSKNSVLNGMGKVFSNTILSDQESDKAKEIYQNYKNDEGDK